MFIWRRILKRLLPVVLFVFLLCVVSFLYLRSFRFHFNKTEHARIDSNVFKRYRKPHPINSFNANSTKNNQPFTAKSFSEKWSLVYIGAISSNPTLMIELSKFNELVDRIKNNLSLKTDVNLLYLSAAPKIEELSSIANEFKDFSNITGLISTNADERTLSTVIHSPILINNPDSNGNINISHPKNLYLVGPNNKLLGYFTHPFNVTLMYKNFVRIYNCGVKLCVK